MKHMRARGVKAKGAHDCMFAVFQWTSNRSCRGGGE